MERRAFLKLAAGAGLATIARGADPEGEISWTKLPRWRGFNLLEKFTSGRKAPFLESDFAWIKELGFDFVRLPMDYRCWTDPKDLRKLDEGALKEIDQAVAWGKRYGIHVNLNFHRAPGYCVNPPKEPIDLWTDPKARETCAFHWAHFAERYRGIPNREVSFDLLNEPARIPVPSYVEVVRVLTDAIRGKDPRRLIVADGLAWGREPVEELIPLRVAQSTRGYDPMRITHHRANWIGGSDKWAEPTWPLGGTDKEKIRADRIAPWKKLEARGVGVHVGEWGVFNRTPHAVALAFMRDMLSLWKEAGWGWALWNFRGSFGILDSGRGDVKYEDWRGRKLDRKMLELLRQG
ncbi:MAG: cellulase family glycosylhydrolase [Planctomycetes bacterium]|nr:cellulase family glycosylhydrolase [Planctomycetota bacterium]